MKNDAMLSLGGVILLGVMIIVIAILLIFIMLPPSCDERDQVELTGVLYGFEKNNTVWNVRLGNTTYTFQHFDESYTERLIGFNVTITCCSIGEHYNFVTAYINEEVD